MGYDIDDCGCSSLFEEDIRIIPLSAIMSMKKGRLRKQIGLFSYISVLSLSLVINGI
jgi:hypothetical protein